MAELGNNNNGAKTTSSRFSFFNRSLTTLRNEPPPQKPPQLDRSLTKLVESGRGGGGGSVVKRLCSFFESAKPSSPEKQKNPKLKPSKFIENSNSDSASKSLDSPAIRLPGTEDRIVLYFTSLRGIRRTYEDCYAVRMIFRGFRVWVDERDISMDANYRKELMSALFGENNNNNNKKGHVALPQVFIRGRHVGGADVIKHMWEVGELEKVLEGLPRTKGGFVCESCGDVRFAPCGNCSGSRKVFDEDEEVLKRCLECNENGLIRCPNCCSS